MSNSPSTYWKDKPFLYKAANDRMLIVCTCLNCRKTVTYLALDLIPIHGPQAIVGSLWGRCPRCGSQVNWRERQRFPSSDDVGHLVLRRPNGFRKIHLWTNAYYAPPPYGPPWPPPFDLGSTLRLP